MKNIYLSLGLLFAGILMIQAQFTVANHDGTPITDGSIFTYSDIGTISDSNDVDLVFDITNTGSNAIDMRCEYVSMANGDGTGTFFCVFGLCHAPGGIVPGTVYGGPETIIPVGETPPGNHFYNMDAGDGVNYPIEYVFRLFQVDTSGNEIGDSLTFTYQYDGTAAVEDIAQVGFKLYPNVSSDYINLEVDESVSAQLINTQGQLIKEYNFESGSHTIDVSIFTKQMYYLKLRNAQGQQSLAKILVK